MGKIRHSGKKRRKNANALRVVLVFFCLLLILTVAADYQFRPLIRSVASDRAATATNLRINETVTQVLAEYGADYEDMVQIRTDAEGRVTCVSMNMMAVNTIRFDLTRRIQESISKYDRQTISIPLGTLAGQDFLLGRGPALRIRLDISNRIDTRVFSELTEAGINQTRHKIMFEITTQVTALIPWYRTATKITTDFLLAETVIVGAVPDAFTHVVTDAVDIADNLANYSAENG